MWRYIDEEPAVLQRLLVSRQAEEAVARLPDDLAAVYFVCHGSSYNAAVATVDFFVRAGLRAYAYTPSNLFTLGASLMLENPAKTLVIGVSQTGTSAGALFALQRAKSLGFLTLALTAVSGSPIELTADQTLNLLCGEEDSNAKTKGYTATLSLLILLSLAVGARRGTLSSETCGAVRNELIDCCRLIPDVRRSAVDFCTRTHFGSNLQYLYVLGSGVNFGSAQEGQLKLMETMCIPTMFNDIGEFSHGMHRSIKADSSLVLIKSNDDAADQVQQSYDYMKCLSDRVYLINASDDGSADENCLCLPKLPLTNSLLLVTLVIQVMSVFSPEWNRQDPNRDANNDFTIVSNTRVR